MSERDQLLLDDNLWSAPIAVLLLLALMSIPSLIRAAHRLHRDRLDAVRRGTHTSGTGTRAGEAGPGAGAQTAVRPVTPSPATGRTAPSSRNHATTETS